MSSHLRVNALSELCIEEGRGKVNTPRHERGQYPQDTQGLAQVPRDGYLMDWFKRQPDLMQQMYDLFRERGDSAVIVYGEIWGAGIRKGTRDKFRVGGLERSRQAELWE